MTTEISKAACVTTIAEAPTQAGGLETGFAAQDHPCEAPVRACGSYVMAKRRYRQ